MHDSIIRPDPIPEKNIDVKKGTDFMFGSIYKLS